MWVEVFKSLFSFVSTWTRTDFRNDVGHNESGLFSAVGSTVRACSTAHSVAAIVPLISMRVMLRAGFCSDITMVTFVYSQAEALHLWRNAPDSFSEVSKTSVRCAGAVARGVFLGLSQKLNGTFLSLPMFNVEWQKAGNFLYDEEIFSEERFWWLPFVRKTAVGSISLFTWF